MVALKQKRRSDQQRLTYEDFPTVIEARDRLAQLTAERSDVHDRLIEAQEIAGTPSNGHSAGVLAEAERLLVGDSGGGDTPAVAYERVAELQHQREVLDAAIIMQQEKFDEAQHECRREIEASWRPEVEAIANTMCDHLVALDECAASLEEIRAQAARAGCHHGATPHYTGPIRSKAIIQAWRADLERRLGRRK